MVQYNPAQDVKVRRHIFFLLKNNTRVRTHDVKDTYKTLFITIITDPKFIVTFTKKKSLKIKIKKSQYSTRSY